MAALKTAMLHAKVYASTFYMDHLEKLNFILNVLTTISQKKRHSRSREKLECGTWEMSNSV